MSRVFGYWSGRVGFNPWLSHTKNSEMVLYVALVNTQYYTVNIKGKMELSREKSSVLPFISVWYLLKMEPSCHQLYIFLFIAFN